MPNTKTNHWLILTVITLTLLPLLFVKADFSGADGQAENAISEIQPDYEPWISPLVELPGGEVESLLFASQAAIGAGLIGYVIGLYRGRREQASPQLSESEEDR